MEINKVNYQGYRRKKTIDNIPNNTDRYSAERVQGIGYIFDYYNSMSNVNNTDSVHCLISIHCVVFVIISSYHIQLNTA